MLLRVVLKYSRVSAPGTKIVLHSGTIQATSQLNRVCGFKQMLHLRKCWIPLQEVLLQQNPWQESFIFLLMIFSEQVEPKSNNVFLSRLRKDFQVGSEDWNVVHFTGQRIRWTKDSQSGPSIEVSQEKAIGELEEIPVEMKTKEDLHCTRAMHAK